MQVLGLHGALKFRALIPERELLPQLPPQLPPLPRLVARVPPQLPAFPGVLCVVLNPAAPPPRRALSARGDAAARLRRPGADAEAGI